ncbi:SDR family oxidoreductase [Actinoplanes solisilvae]|uniref:SDR family oxidoreductase n=1 Tax=Actinoplanes solisilvae TaxID=2486853 RepID=UPI000FD7FE87|nr:SDR family oxidoreductase [Actinoplanes solisilvae]
MKVVVVGGTGLIGQKLISLLKGAGHDAVAASKSLGVDVISGEGLAEAFRGADVVVDVTNSPSWADDDVLAFFTTSTRNQVEAEKAAGVGHHVAVTIVNAETMPGAGYMRAKVAQEQVIEESGIPYTILRATQFHEFVEGIAGFGTADGETRITTAAFQPVAGDDVAATLAELVELPPVNGIVNLGGPEVRPMSDFVRHFLEHTNDSRKLVEDLSAGYFGAEIDDTSLTTREGARIGVISYKQFLDGK